MAKVERSVVADGDIYLVQCALDQNGDSPAATFLDELERGMWEDDPNDHDRPSDEQIYDYPRLIAIIETFAQLGEPPHARAVNSLEAGVWEFKHSDKRVSFFDTPGDGTYTAKMRFRNVAECDSPASSHWWLPNFDEYIRLGHCFGKTGQTTTATDMAASLQMREEDLGHDQAD